MSIASAADLLVAVRQFQLLDEGEIHEAAQFGAHCADSGQLADELVRRGWLTPWQVKTLAQNRGPELTLGSYTLLEFLGQGSMGQVFKARQRRLKRLVALKLIHPQYLEKPIAVTRFHREAEAAARLNHPNIVQIYDAGEIDSAHYLAMEYVEGTDLEKRVANGGPVAVALACEWTRQAALGLQHAHEQGLVHRDIKPSNLMVRHGSGTQPAGVIKILDLGMARLDRLTCDSKSLQVLTETGSAMGTPAYLAPEQAMDAHKADIRADIYSLGCTLYHLLAGRMPFLASNLAQMFTFHLMKDPEPLTTLRADVPEGLWLTVRIMMAKNPDDRQQTPGEVAQALAAWVKFSEEMSAQAATLPAAKLTADPTGIAIDVSARSLLAAPRIPDDFGTLRPEAAAVLRAPLTATRSGSGSKTVPEPPPHPPRRRSLAVLGLLALGVLLAAGVGGSALLAPELFDEALRRTRGLFAGRDMGSKAPTAQAPATIEPDTTAQRSAAPGTFPDVNPPHVATKPMPPDKTMTNSIGMKMVLIPTGKFLMGSPGTEKAREDNEGPQHEVEITKSFYLGVYEVTQAEYEKVMNDNPSRFRAPIGKHTRHLPVELVSWHEALRFCRKLSELPEEKAAGRVYRLPTEAEWEYTCRAGTRTPYHGGATLTAQDANTSNAVNRTTPVGSYRANAFGLHDMHGNVWEWCSDWYRPYSKDELKDPPEASGRVLRGGSWHCEDDECRAAKRSERDPGLRYDNVGFRAVLSVAPMGR